MKGETKDMPLNVSWSAKLADTSQVKLRFRRRLQFATRCPTGTFYNSQLCPIEADPGDRENPIIADAESRAGGTDRLEMHLTGQIRAIRGFGKREGCGKTVCNTVAPAQHEILDNLSNLNSSGVYRSSVLRFSRQLEKRDTVDSDGRTLYCAGNFAAAECHNIYCQEISREMS